VPEENFLTLWCKGRLTEADTPTIRLGGTPSGLTSAHLQHQRLPVTGCRKFICVDDICLGRQARTFAELECALTADMAHTEEYCHCRRLKPSVFKTVCSVFHLHNASSGRALKLTLNDQPLRHEPHPAYLGVTLDHTLNYKQHLTEIANKVKSCNSLLMKLTNTSWGANAKTPANVFHSSPLHRWAGHVVRMSDS